MYTETGTHGSNREGREIIFPLDSTIETGDVLRCTIWVQAQQTWTVKNADQAARCIGKERGMGGFNVFRTNNSRNYTYTVYD